MSFTVTRVTPARLAAIPDAAIDKAAARVPEADRCASVPYDRDLITKFVNDDSRAALVAIDENGDYYGVLLLNDMGDGVARASWQGPLDNRIGEAFSALEDLIAARGFTVLEGAVTNARLRARLEPLPKIRAVAGSSYLMRYVL